jgi:glycine/D-amino acid oxidase-like deaminating enzyme
MPRTRYGVSPWIHQFPDSRRPDFPRARGNATTDVVIIGGGLTGCAIAHACAVAGVKCIVLESNRIGQGSGGRSAGMLLPDPGPTFRGVAQAHGLRAARRVFQSWRRASLDAAALIRRLGIRCGLTPQDSLIVAWRDEEKVLRRELDARQEAGLEVTLLTRKALQQVTALEGAAAIKQRDAFGLDPYRVCLGLATAALKRRANLFERTPVTKVRFGRRHVDVFTESGIIRASTAIVTTGSATREFKPLRRHFKRRESYLVLTEPVPASIRKALGSRSATISDLRVPRHRIRFTPDDRILVGGADQNETPARTRDGVLVQRTGQLMYELLTIYPAISGLMPAYGWELSYGEPADGLPYIGPHRNYPHHLFALGGAGDSITSAFLSARILVRAITGAPDKSDQLFGFTR